MFTSKEELEEVLFLLSFLVNFLFNMQGNSFREVPLTWAGRVRTSNKQTFDYAKDYEVTCRFNEPLTREKIYKEVQ